MKSFVSLSNLVYIAGVSAVGLAAVLLASEALHHPAVNISAGVTAAWLAGMFLPCPCHRKGGRR